jgi:hypothetical protein
VAGGYDEAMILVVVAAITTDRLLSTRLSDEELDLNNPLPAETCAKSYD